MSQDTTRLASCPHPLIADRAKYIQGVWYTREIPPECRVRARCHPGGLKGEYENRQPDPPIAGVQLPVVTFTFPKPDQLTQKDVFRLEEHSTNQRRLACKSVTHKSKSCGSKYIYIFIYFPVRQDKQAQDTARHAATAAKATAALRRSVSNTTRGQTHEAGAAGPTRRASRSNPWNQHGAPQQRGVAGKGVLPRTVRGAGSTVPLRSNGNTAVADRPVRWTHGPGDFAAIGKGGFGSRGGVTQPQVAVAGPEAVCGGEASVAARCSYCGGQDAPELTLQAAGGGGCAPPGEPGGVGAKPLEVGRAGFSNARIDRRKLHSASTMPSPLSFKSFTSIRCCEI